MPVIYGEGKENAVRRLKKEIDDVFKNKESLRHLYATDPRVDNGQSFAGINQGTINYANRDYNSCKHLISRPSMMVSS
jgi:hypothetical protein